MSELSAEQAYGTAMQYFNAGRLREAESLFGRILAAVPDQPQVLQMLAIVMHQLGRGTAGIELIRRAIDLDPNEPRLRSNLGAMLGSMGELDAAAAELRKGIAIDPQLADAHNNLGNIFKSLGKPDESLAEYRKAVECRADYPEARNNLGASLREHGLYEQATAELQRAIQLRPDYPEAFTNLGNVLHDLGRLEEAIAQYRKAIAIRPIYPEAHHHLAVSLRGLNRLGEAMDEFRKALDQRPKYPEALWGIAFLMLLQGDWANGWRLFEARSQLSGRTQPLDPTQGVWDGSPLNGKPILLYGEQGLGDTIQFARYIPMVKSRDGRPVLVCPWPLKRLLQGQLEIEYIASDGEPLPPCEVRCSLMSLPRIFQTTLDEIPGKVPYVNVDASLARKWGDRLAAESGKLKIGVVWTGNRQHLNDRNRSVPLSAFGPITRLPRARLISLQKGQAAGDISTSGVDILHWTAELTDMADTAALIANLDLVISVDTSVAHVAGAMAKQTWMMLPFAPDWRWMLNRSDSPWYPTMRLFRQKAPGDWTAPLQEIPAELEKLASR